MSIRTHLLAGLTVATLAFGALVMTPTTFADPGKDKPAAAQPAAKDKDAKDSKEAKKAEPAKVGDKAPAFALKDLDGKEVKLADLLKGKKAVVIEWFNPECPVIAGHHKKGTFNKLYKEFASKDVAFVAINSSGPGMEGNDKEANVKAKKDWSIEYPILNDESGDVGRAYGAKTTPHMYIVNADGNLVYTGAIDNNRDGTKTDKDLVNYVQKALNEVLAGTNVTEATTKQYGCGVKYGKK